VSADNVRPFPVPSDGGPVIAPTFSLGFDQGYSLGYSQGQSDAAEVYMAEAAGEIERAQQWGTWILVVGFWAGALTTLATAYWLVPLIRGWLP
jgi:hypothetical protein